MTAINRELYHALLEAGASEEKADEAASSVVNDDMEQIKIEMAVLSSKMTLMERLLWIVIGGLISILLKLFL